MPSLACPIAVFCEESFSGWTVKVGIVCVERRLPLRVALVYHKLFYRKIEPKQNEKTSNKIICQNKPPTNPCGTFVNKKNRFR